MLSILGYCTLVALTAVLLGQAQAQAVRNAPVWSVLLIGVVAAVLFQCRNEWLRAFRSGPMAAGGRDTPALTALAVIAGAMTTFLLANALELGAVVAAGIVGLLGALISPRKAAAAYCGAFVGMVSPDCLHAATHLLLAALLAAGVFLLAAPVFNGFGGKLGTIAFTGCVAAAWLAGNPLSQAPIPSARVNALIVLYSVLAAVATFSLSVRVKLGPVSASSLVGLLGGLFLPRLMPETGPLLAVVIICASFTGMSSRERLPDERHLLLAGLITGFLFVFTLPVMGGAGGKLGTIAFASSMAARTLTDWIARRTKREGLPGPSAVEPNAAAASETKTDSMGEIRETGEEQDGQTGGSDSPKTREP